MKSSVGRTMLFAALAAGCDTPTGPVGQPADRFGAVTAVIDGRQWVSSYFPDSTVAFYNPVMKELQVIGQEVMPGLWPSFRMRIRTGATSGAYPVGSYAESIFGEWFVAEKADRPHAAGSELRAFLSTGAPGDSLVIEELDLAQRVIRGRFSFSARLLHSLREVKLVGRFAGRFQTP